VQRKAALQKYIYDISIPINRWGEHVEYEKCDIGIGILQCVEARLFEHDRATSFLTSAHCSMCQETTPAPKREVNEAMDRVRWFAEQLVEHKRVHHRTGRSFAAGRVNRISPASRLLILDSPKISEIGAGHETQVYAPAQFWRHSRFHLPSMLQDYRDGRA